MVAGVWGVEGELEGEGEGRGGQEVEAGEGQADGRGRGQGLRQEEEGRLCGGRAGNQSNLVWVGADLRVMK